MNNTKKVMKWVVHIFCFLLLVDSLIGFKGASFDFCHLFFSDQWALYVNALFEGRILFQFFKHASSRINRALWTLFIYSIWNFFVEEKGKWNVYRWEEEFLHWIKGLGMGIGVGSLSFIGYLYFFQIPFSADIKVGDLALNLLAVLFLSTMSSMREELIFRDYLFQKLKPLGIHISILLQAIYFGLLHAPNNPNNPLPIMITTAIGGLLFAYARLYTGSLLTSIGLHTGLHLLNIINHPMFSCDLSSMGDHEGFWWILGPNFFGFFGQLLIFLLTLFFFWSSRGKKQRSFSQ